MAFPNLNDVVLTTIRNRVDTGRVYYREGAVDRILEAAYATATKHWTTTGMIEKLTRLIEAEEIYKSDLQAGKLDRWPGLPEWGHEEFVADYITGMINREFPSGENDRG